MNGKCGQGTYFGPLGKCEDCGKLCDRPSQYPDSCRTHCPDYIPKERPSTPNLHEPSTSENVRPFIIGGFSFLGLLFILVVLWKKVFRRRCQLIVAERRRRKELVIPARIPIQAQAVAEDQARVPLNSIFESTDDSDTVSIDSIAGEFGNNAMAASNQIEMNEPTERSDSAQTVITISYELSHDPRSDEFDFGQTFPFNSLSSLESVFQDSSDQTRRKTPTKT